MIAEHVKSGKLYEVVSLIGAMKNPETGEWLNAVIYVPKYKVPEVEIFCRERNDFYSKFRLIAEGINGSG